MILIGTAGLAHADGYPFDPDHGRPFNFTFGNHFDTHQQSRTLGKNRLFGFLYVTNTGETKGGIPVAKHCNITVDSMPEEIDACYVGWYMSGRMGEADFVFHDKDHPLWRVDRDKIPQPGAFAHFHWLGDPNKAGGLSSAGKKTWRG